MQAKLTDKQRQALEHLEGSRREGVTLSAYARGHGLALREIYDALAALRRKGVLPRPAQPSAQSAFVALRVTPRAALAGPVVHAAAGGGMICRVLLGGAVVIECAQWPAAAWLSSLLGAGADAAP